MAVAAVFAANALILWVALSKRGFRMISPGYAAIVAAPPSLSRKRGIWAILGADLLSGPLGLSLFALVQWFGTQATYLLEPIVNR